MPHKGYKQTEEHISKRAEKVSKALIGNKYTLGYKHTGETRLKMSEAGKKKIFTEKHRFKLSEAAVGNINAWIDGRSYEPYCELFNNKLKEEIRNRDNRVCVLCDKSEILNGQRLSVHHIDGDKMQGCSGKKWHLVTLCRSCNSKPDTIEKEFLIMSNNSRRE